MRYQLTGLELEYRDCQMLRNAAEEWLAGDMENGKERLRAEKEQFIEFLLEQVELEELESKKERLKKLAKGISWMTKEYYEVLIAYIAYLLLPESQIDLNIPFDIDTGCYILPVNTHRDDTERIYEEEDDF